MAHSASRAAAFCAVLLACTFATHGADWSAPAPGGTRITIVEDPGRTGGGFRLERRLADGRLDPQFGNGGSLSVTLGPDDDAPAVLRVDGQGRAWVAGASEAADGQRAVVLRFSSSGRPDSAYAVNGRSATAPAGRDARALDLLPLDDGSAWVAGTVADREGDQRSGIWRLRPDGSVDVRFGQGGVWIDGGRGATDPAGLLRSPDGEFALGLRRSDGAQASLEVWAWREGSDPRRAFALAAEARTAELSRLAWRNGGWQWIAGRAAEASAPTPAAPAVGEGERESQGTAIATPFAERPAAAGSAPPPDDAAWGWWLLLPAALAGLWWWRRQGSATPD